MYALNLAEDGRILSVCTVLPDSNYEDMPIVDVFPEGDITEYRYVDGEFIHDPIPKPEQPEPVSLESRVNELEEALSMILAGVTE